MCLLKESVEHNPGKKPIPSQEGEASSYTPSPTSPVAFWHNCLGGIATRTPRRESPSSPVKACLPIPFRAASGRTNPAPGPGGPRQSGPAPYSSGGWHGRSDGSWPAPDEVRPASFGLHGRCQGRWTEGVGRFYWAVWGGVRGMEFALPLRLVGRPVCQACAAGDTEATGRASPPFPW